MSRLTKYDHLPEFVRRRLEPRKNYPLAREEPSRQLIRIRAIMEKLDPFEMQQPTQREIAELAIDLATEEWPWLHQKFEAILVFHHPPWAEPLQGFLGAYLPWVNKYRAEAEKQLREHYAYYRVLDLRRQRWLRAHPEPRGWAWTRKQLDHPIPARKRIYRPPGEEYPDAVSPPVPAHPAGSPNRPGWREREVLLCYTWLFGNRIVVYLSIAGRAHPVPSPLGERVRVRVRNTVCITIRFRIYPIPSRAPVLIMNSSIRRTIQQECGAA